MNPKEVSAKLKNIASTLKDDPDKDQIIQELGSVLVALDTMSIMQPVGALVHQLNQWLHAKYAIDAAYRSYADRTRGPWRDALVKHWYEHAEEERAQAYKLSMKLVALEADPMVTSIEVPQCPSNLQAMCSVLMGLELQAIENAYKTIELAGGDATIRIMAEDIMLADSHHLDDLIRLYPEA